MAFAAQPDAVVAVAKVLGMYGQLADVVNVHRGGDLAVLAQRMFAEEGQAEALINFLVVELPVDKTGTLRLGDLLPLRLDKCRAARLVLLCGLRHW